MCQVGAIVSTRSRSVNLGFGKVYLRLTFEHHYDRIWACISTIWAVAALRGGGKIYRTG